MSAEPAPGAAPPNIATIAGSDPSGGAGIQADLKTFAALGGYGCAVLTALTAQNTHGVDAIHAPPASFVREQIDTLLRDVDVAAIKIGMVGGPEAIQAVADALRHWQPAHVVLDPVMVAKSGDRLLPEDAEATLAQELLPLATVVTPNLPEAALLAGQAAPEELMGMRQLAEAVRGQGPQAVLLKGGHLAGNDSPDVLDDGRHVLDLPQERVATDNTHGTGCTLSSALATLLAHNAGRLAPSVKDAKAYVTAALAGSDRLQVGSGHGPLHHFHNLWPADGPPPATRG